MLRIMKFTKLYILSMLIVIVPEIYGSEANTNYKFQYLNNRLSVNAEKTRIGPLLEEFQKIAEIKFLISKEEYNRIISVHFQSLPIEKALEKILCNLDHAIVYNSNGNIQLVKIVSKGSISSKAHLLPSNNIKIKTQSIEKMKITHGGEDMIITHDGEDMIITNDGEDMVITHGGEDMIITNDGEDMVITHGGEDMKITHDGEEVKITN